MSTCWPQGPPGDGKTHHNPLALGSQLLPWEVTRKPGRGENRAECALGQHLEGWGLEDWCREQRHLSGEGRPGAEWWKEFTEVLQWEQSGCLE